MLLAADENFNGRILRALQRRLTDLDIVRVQDTERSGKAMSAEFQVVAYAGYQGEQEPLFLVRGDERLGVEIRGRWREPDARCFRATRADESTCCAAACPSSNGSSKARRASAGSRGFQSPAGSDRVSWVNDARLQTMTAGPLPAGHRVYCPCVGEEKPC